MNAAKIMMVVVCAVGLTAWLGPRAGVAQQAQVEEMVEPQDSPADDQAQGDAGSDAAGVDQPPAMPEADAPAPADQAPEVQQPQVEQ